MAKDSIVHSVIFNLKHPQGSEEENRFIEDGRAILTSIPVVQNFKVYRQVSPKNEYAFGFSMEFANAEDYETYNLHPLHVSFVSERWETEVLNFLEIDYKEKDKDEDTSET
ncbi:Dabb family protein [Cohnella abietis]|uniref:Stress responsive protein n=1 Tax=Cohnella abietis TaxID=2507935 RepID=A0A3T1D594_9BACL|nr:Dabb family protein [Cohnella abietis]BBI33283.1 stress responsive protein [Cohnella abietis]